MVVVARSTAAFPSVTAVATALLLAAVVVVSVMTTTPGTAQVPAAIPSAELDELTRFLQRRAAVVLVVVAYIARVA